MINESISTQINAFKDLLEWVRFNCQKSCNFEINFWCHPGSTNDKIEYRFWVDGLINKSSENLEEFAEKIPKFKRFCEMYMELSQ